MTNRPQGNIGSPPANGFNNEHSHKSSKRRSRVETGRLGEEAAAAYLQSEGYVIRSRNWRCKAGELDIVAEFGGVTVIVEVRTRTAGSTAAFGTAVESIDARKVYKVRTMAALYLQSHGLQHTAVRCDAVIVLLGQDGGAVEISHMQNVL
ncbi:YraN family protein [Paenibacillus kobensis]|uniref:YraN family protein n=1 Tax=Paenibacillus kobensis TaxID=59841 RepID=UPI000FD962EF|nr:YraN family protein [Paenibacillus kobensis]